MLANGQLMRAPAYGPLVIAYRNGNPVRLNEVARVYDGIEQDKSANFYRGMRNINLAIQKQPGTNVVAVVDAVKDAAADVPRAAAAVGDARRAHRSLGVHPRVGARREVHAVC